MKLNLDPQYIDDYWKLKSVDLAQFLQQVSNLEKWTLTDSHIFQSRLRKFLLICKSWEFMDYTINSDQIIELMMYMNISQFAYFSQYMESMYPAFTIHCMIGTREREDWEAGQLLLHRLSIINEFGYLQNIFPPMRVKLMQGLLEDNEYEMD